MMSDRGNLITASDRAAPYTGADRRAVAQAPGSTLGFLGLVAVCLCGVTAIAVSVGLEAVEVRQDSTVLTTGLAAAAVVLVLSGGLIAGARHVTSARSSDLDLAVLMTLVSLGWLLPLRVVGPAGLGEIAWLEPVALGTSISVLVLTGIIAFGSVGRLGLEGGSLTLVALGPTLFTTASSRLSETAFPEMILPIVGLGALGVAAVVGLVRGISKQRWLLAFVGLQMLGIGVSEFLGIQGQGGSDAWVVAAGMVALSAGAIGLYGVVIDIRTSSFGQEAKLSETFNRLQHAQRIALEERQANQNRLHSLRSGLLAVETLVSLPKNTSEQLTDVVAMEVARLKELTKSTPLKQVVFDIVPNLRALVEIQHRQGIGATLDVPGPVEVFAAQAETVDAIQSLIHNAVRHAPGSSILVSADYVAADEIVATVSVSDRGPGVPERLQKKIFERGMTTHSDGTGLGLPFARQIAEAQGGSLTYHDRLGGGATFTLRLVVKQEALSGQNPKDMAL